MRPHVVKGVEQNMCARLFYVVAIAMCPGDFVTLTAASPQPCQPQGLQGTRTESGSSDDVRLGLLLPMSGWPAGRFIAGAATLAIEHVNSDRTLMNGRRLTFLWEDSGCRWPPLVFFMQHQAHSYTSKRGRTPPTPLTPTPPAPFVSQRDQRGLCDERAA